MNNIFKITATMILLSLSVFCTAYAHTCSPEEESQRTIEEINEERANVGICPVCGEKHLGDCSCQRAHEVCNNFSHTRPDGSPYYTVGPDYVYGEILGRGANSSEQIVDEWMGSECHRQEILNPNYNDVGVTVLDNGGKRYWVVEFGY